MRKSHFKLFFLECSESLLLTGRQEDSPTRSDCLCDCSGKPHFSLKLQGSLSPKPHSSTMESGRASKFSSAQSLEERRRKEHISQSMHRYFLHWLGTKQLWYNLRILSMPLSVLTYQQ